MKILVADDDDLIRESVGLAIQCATDAEIVEAPNGHDAIKIIDTAQSLDCIICDFKMPKGSGEEVINHLTKIGSDIPFILCSGDPPASLDKFTSYNHWLGLVQKPDLHEPIRRLLQTLLQLQDVRQNAAAETYCHTSTTTLKQIGVLNTDVYIRLSDHKFLKILNKGDLFSETDHDRFRAKGVDRLHILKTDAPALVQAILTHIKTSADLSHLSVTPETLVSYAEKIAEKLDNPEIAADVRSLAQAVGEHHPGDFGVSSTTFRISERAQNLVHDALVKFGMSPEVQTLTKASVSVAVKTIKATPSIAQLFEKRYVPTPDNFYSSQAILSAYVSCGLASSMGWASDLIRYKLVFASILHDIMLSDPAIATCDSFADLAMRPETFQPQAIAEFERHPMNTVRLVRTIPNLPPDVDIIVEQHHEKPDGSGFPKRIDHRHIHKLAGLFIVAQDLVSFINQKLDNTWPMSEFTNSVPPQHKLGYFENIYGTLRQFKR